MLSLDDKSELRSVVKVAIGLLERGQAPEFKSAYHKAMILNALANNGSMEKEFLISEVKRKSVVFEPYVNSILEELCQDEVSSDGMSDD